MLCFFHEVSQIFIIPLFLLFSARFSLSKIPVRLSNFHSVDFVSKVKLFWFVTVDVKKYDFLYESHSIS